MGLKVFKVTIISSIVAIFMAILGRTMPAMLTISFIALVVAVIAAVIMGPNYIARLSDIYLDNIEGIYDDMKEDIEVI